MPYFYASERHGDTVSIQGGDARHLAGPLRARPGELIQVVEPAGLLLGVRLVSVTSREVVGTVEWSREHEPEPRSDLWIGMALLPAAGLEHVLSRATEIGARGFLLINAERSVARADKAARWKTICREAAMLSGRTSIPEVRGPIALSEALTFGRPLLLDRDATRRLQDLAAESIGDQASRTVLLIGPEGGWSPAEVALAGDSTASLGPRNLRADTAALAAASVWLGARGDL